MAQGRPSHAQTLAHARRGIGGRHEHHGCALSAEPRRAAAGICVIDAEIIPPTHEKGAAMSIGAL